jgi:phosphonate transport system substrate-binding protein
MLTLIRSILLLLSASTAATAAEVPAPLTVGSVAMDIPAVMYQRLRPLANYLEQELGRPVALKPAPDLSKAADEIAGGQVDISYLTPMAYLKAKGKGNVQVIAKIQTKGQDTFRLMLVAREDSPIKSPRDLVGKRFAFGDAAAVLQRAVVVNAGVKLEELGSYRYLGHYDNIARGVANGDFNAGILKDTTAEQWKSKGLKVIHTSPPLPPYNIAVNRALDDATRNKIRAALLKLSSSNPEHAKVLKALDEGYTGFAAASEEDYRLVEEMVAPFLAKK